MIDHQTRKGMLQEHVIWASEKGFCDQCVRPWNKGICTCGNFNNVLIQRIYDVFVELETENRQNREWHKVLNEI